MKSPRAKTGVAGLALLTLAAVAWSIAHAKSEEHVNRARFAADGSARRPVEWRQWVHVGTRYKPIGLNILDQKLTKTPEILNAYVEPSAMAVYQQTGQWPEGAQIVKEFTAVQVGPGCDAKTFVCSTRFGDGITRAAIWGLAIWSRTRPAFRSSLATGATSASAISRSRTSQRRSPRPIASHAM